MNAAPPELDTAHAPTAANFSTGLATLADALVEHFAPASQVYAHLYRAGQCTTITRGELAHGAARFANHYREHAVEPGTVVLIILPHSPDLLHAFLGAILAGCVPSFTPHTRETRLAAAARLAGWEPFHICIGKPKYLPADYFSFHAQLSDAISLTLACWLFPGSLIHAFAMSGDHAILLAWLKPRRLIIDLYDTCSGNLSISPETQKLEREVLATADGITHRDVRIKRLQKLRGYALPKKNLFIHDPLPEIPPSDPSPRLNDGIHVVSTGWVGSGDDSILRVAKALCVHGIHLHVYFNPFQQGISPDTQCYWDLQKETPYFHIESPVYGDAYWAALKKYDFGLSVLEAAISDEPMATFTKDALTGCGSSRLSDYIAADLAVIASPELNFIYFWARHFAVATVPATTSFLQNPLPALRHALQIKATRRLIDRSSITIQGASHRLGKFYQKVAA